MRKQNFAVIHTHYDKVINMEESVGKPGNPSRPIAASNGAPMENMSCFADFFLWPSVIQLPSYIQDTTDFINELWRLPIQPPDCILLRLRDTVRGVWFSVNFNLQ